MSVDALWASWLHAAIILLCAALASRVGPNLIRWSLRGTRPTFRVVITHLSVALIWIVAATLILSEFGAVLLAGAGVAVVTVAIATSTTTLGNSIVAGLWLALEGDLNLGDQVTIAGVSGAIRDMQVRKIMLDNPETGQTHHVPSSLVLTSVVTVSRITPVAARPPAP